VINYLQKSNKTKK